MKNKKKLKLVKCNKKLQNNLNITKEDFQVYIELKEFNEKFSTNIEDIDITELNLSKKNITNEGLELLSQFKFKNLKILDLSQSGLNQNTITNIKLL